MEEKYRNIPKLMDYHVSPFCGFLLEKPLRELPPYFEAWNELGRRMAQLMETQTLRDHVHKMLLLDHTRLEGHHQNRQALNILVAAVNAYITMDGRMAMKKVLPRQLAVPWCGVCDELGVTRDYGYNNSILGNYRILDESSPVTMENIACLVSYPGNDWMPRLVMQYEFDAAPAIQAIVEGMRAVVDDDQEKMASALETMRESVIKIKSTLSRIHEGVPVEIFQQVVPAMLYGWGGSGCLYPEGVIYEGVSEEPQKSVLFSAAHSCSFQCFDLALGIEHVPEEMVNFAHIRRLWFPKHREFFKALEKGPSIKQYIAEKNNPTLKELHQQCVDIIKEFRSYHIQVVTKYQLKILVEEEKLQREYEGRPPALKEEGNEIMNMLKQMRNETVSTLNKSG